LGLNRRAVLTATAAREIRRRHWSCCRLRLWGPGAAQPDIVASGLRMVEAAVRGEQVRVVVFEVAAAIHRGVGRR
jgi:hypothetical protein